MLEEIALLPESCTPISRHRAHPASSEAAPGSGGPARIRTTVADLGHDLASAGLIWPGSGQCRQQLTNVFNLTDLGRCWPASASKSHRVGGCWPCYAQTGQELTICCRYGSSQVWANGKHRPDHATNPPRLAEVGSNLRVRNNCWTTLELAGLSGVKFPGKCGEQLFRNCRTTESYRTSSASTMPPTLQTKCGQDAQSQP